MNKTKHIICYSGGESSAKVAVEIERRFGKENIILLNHDINPNYESTDIKRFKKEVADYLGLPITYANYNDVPISEIPNQFEVCIDAKSFIEPKNRQALCTHRLKTKPFKTYLDTYQSEKNCIIYYGFDRDEQSRVERRKTILNDMGYESDYPLALWGEGAYNNFVVWLEESLKKDKDRHEAVRDLFSDGSLDVILKMDLKIENRDDWELTLNSIFDIGIEPPNAYDNFKHANCTGCLKGGKQHWYCVYCLRYDIFQEAKEAEATIGYSIIKGNWLIDLEEDFEKMKCGGIEPSEHTPKAQFWKEAKKYTDETPSDEMPCECLF